MFELAIYGGTFAPVHNGHVRAAEVFLSELSPDRLLIIPTLIPPHKQITYKDNPLDRLEMLHLAFEANPEYGKRLFISDYELNAAPPSYTVNTLRHFSAPGTHITFLCGTDMFLTLHKWYQPEEIMRLCRIALIKRETPDAETEKNITAQSEFLKKKYGADIVTIKAAPLEISSSQLRSGDDELRRRFLPSAVYSYIKEHSLYERH